MGNGGRDGLANCGHQECNTGARAVSSAIGEECVLEDLLHEERQARA
jgi:hypothetical protein